MRIKIINPNTSATMTETIGVAAEKVSHPETEIISSNPSEGTPSIEFMTDEAIAIVGLLEEIKSGEKQQIDAYIIACFGDPGLDAARELTKAPVIGIAEASFHFASLIATHFSIVTTLNRTCEIANRLLHSYGYERHCNKVRATNLPVLDLFDDNSSVYQAILKECLKAKKEDNIGAIVLGCGGMSDFTEQLQEDLDIPIIDGVTAAVKLAEATVSLGLWTSKLGNYDYPPTKKFTGKFKHLSE